MKKLLIGAITLGFISSSALADNVYVTALTSNCTSSAICGQNANADINPNTSLPVYSEGILGSFTTAISTVPYKSPTPGARFFSNSFSNSTPDLGITLRPALAVAGGVYRLYHVYSSAAGNVSTNIVVGVTNVANCTLSFSSTDKFQRSFGAVAGGVNSWQFLGYVTNDVATSNPEITFYFQGGVVNAGASQRLVVDSFRFSLEDPCLDIPTVFPTGPLATNLSDVIVTGVNGSATKVTVFQDNGAGMVSIGELNSGIVAGNNAVPVTGLVRNSVVAATQTVGGQEGCPLDYSAFLVGGGANPRLRVALSVRQTTSTGPVGTAGSTATVGANIHFLGSSTRISGAPGDGPVLIPSPAWQTLTFDRGTATLGNSANAVGSPESNLGYAANDTVAVRVYAYRTVPESGVQIFSAAPAQSSVVTSNDVFAVNWTWDAVANADGYRLLRNFNSDNYVGGSVDVVGVNNFNDANNAWSGAITVTPTSTHTNPAVKWNAQTGASPAGTVYDLNGQWGTIDAIAFAIDDLKDTGPFDLYIDNLQNGSTVFQDFENAVGNTADYAYRSPSFSGTTSGNILGLPNSSRASVRAADTGIKSLHVKFQWNGTNDTKWLRLTTSGAAPVQSPQINLDHPTSIRFLLLPKGSTPVQPVATSLSISNNAAGQRVLSWAGGHNLQASSLVTGTYTNTGVTLGPWTNTLSAQEKFFRLSDPYDD
ncbi:MAG: hypothetical protein HOP33_05935 [Verrucomicrobia bacterium]|nr:hypothetical protein [Verrucomicrobiota bacterium]